MPQGSLFVASSNEGLNLEGAGRLLNGQRPYVDFFGHASPGAYLYQSLVFRLAGRSLSSARSLVIAYQSLQIALLFWLVATCASRLAAWSAIWIYAAIETADAVQLTAHHRWDSSSLGFLWIAMSLAGARRGPLWWMFTGLVAAAAVIATPTAGLFVLVTAVWLLLERRIAAAVSYVGGAAIGVAPVIVWMASRGLFSEGRFGGYVGFLRFMRANYAEANATPYGYIGGGWLNLFDFGQASMAEILVRFPIVLCLGLPALAPVIGLGGWIWWAWRGRDLPVPASAAWYLVACQSAMLIYSIPRVDLSHLAYTSAFACALSAVWIAWQLPRKLAAGVALFLIVGSLAFVYRRASVNAGARRVETPIGSVLVPAVYQSDVTTLLSSVHAGDTMFVYPFMPSLGFLTQARNPTSFLFIQPGMMKDAEERALMEDLRSSRPRWILWFPSTREQFLGAFPGASRLAYHYPRIEDWIEANYVMRAKLPGIAYNLWEVQPPIEGFNVRGEPAAVSAP